MGMKNAEPAHATIASVKVEESFMPGKMMIVQDIQYFADNPECRATPDSD